MRDFNGSTRLSIDTSCHMRVSNSPAARGACTRIAFASLLFTLATPSYGAITAYSDSAAWEAAVSDVMRIGAEQIPLGQIASTEWNGLGVGMWGGGAPFTGVVAGDESAAGLTIAETWGLPAGTHIIKTYDDAFTLEFATPIRAFATTWGTRWDVFMICQLGTQYVGPYQQTTFGNNYGYAPKFIGLTSDLPFNHVTIKSGESAPGDIWKSYSTGFAWSTVPAPSAAPMLLLALLRRRRTR